MGLSANRVIGILLYLSSCIACAAERVDPSEASEPTVGGFWVGVFVVVFVVVCAWFAIAIWRAERTNGAK